MLVDDGDTVYHIRYDATQKHEKHDSVYMFVDSFELKP
jgi:hypothetical protein